MLGVCHAQTYGLVTIRDWVSPLPGRPHVGRVGVFVDSGQCILSFEESL